MSTQSYKVGKVAPSWKEGKAQTITFIVTEDCNLRCKYCYITHKASNKRMNYETAKTFIDYILSDRFKRDEAVILEFIGGEPFMEIQLIDEICDYFKLKALETDSDWYWNYRISICTNGVNYSDAAIQQFIKKNDGKLSLTITIDGTKEKHDLQRVFPDGEGSYDVISENMKLWIKQFPAATKVTFASDDLKYLKDSILSLWENGITDISANVVFEDVWKEDDDVLFENQLKALADYILDHQIFDRHHCSLFDENIGQFYTKEDLKKTSCGSGKMLAVGPEGNLYPCIRYKDYSLNHEQEWTIGNVRDGIDMEKVRPFMTAMYSLQSDEECLNCEVASGCSYCQGFNYDVSEAPTNFHRAKYICKMHKARVRANNYYFAKLYNRYGISKTPTARDNKRMYFLLSDDYVDYCQHGNRATVYRPMGEAEILKGLRYAHQNFYEPVFLHAKSQFNFKNRDDYQGYKILHLIPAEFTEEAKALKNYILVFDKNNLDQLSESMANCMLNVDQTDIPNLFSYVMQILFAADRVNINIQNLSSNFDATEYEKQLMKIKSLLVETYRKTGKLKEINLMTDIYFLHDHNHCKAGDRSLAYGPNGKIYVCGAFYDTDKARHIGDVVEGITGLKKPELYKAANSGLCSLCDALQCINCVHLNLKKTNEVNVSPSYQCRKSFIEREVSRLLQLEVENAFGGRIVEKTEYKEAMGFAEAYIGSFAGYYAYEK